MRFSINTLPASSLAEWAEDFRVATGCIPIAGAETTPEGQSGATATAEPGAAGGEPAGGEGTGEPAAPAAPDFSRLESRMDQVLGRLGEVASALPKPEPGPDPAAQQASQTLEELFGPAPAGEPEAGQPAGDEEFLSGLIQQGVDQRVRPALEQIMTQFNEDKAQRETQRREAETRELLSDYPIIREDESYRGELISEARSWAADLGADPALAGEPGFIELVHLANQTLERGKSETPAGGEQGQVALETGAGAAPGQTGQQPDRAQQIVDARRGGDRGIF